MPSQTRCGGRPGEPNYIGTRRATPVAGDQPIRCPGCEDCQRVERWNNPEWLHGDGRLLEALREGPEEWWTRDAADRIEALASHVTVLEERLQQVADIAEGEKAQRFHRLRVRAEAAEHSLSLAREALRYIAGEDVAGYDAHMRPEEVARATLSRPGLIGDAPSDSWTGVPTNAERRRCWKCAHAALSGGGE